MNRRALAVITTVSLAACGAGDSSPEVAQGEGRAPVVAELDPTTTQPTTGGEYEENPNNQQTVPVKSLVEATVKVSVVEQEDTDAAPSTQASTSKSTTTTTIQETTTTTTSPEQAERERLSNRMMNQEDRYAESIAPNVEEAKTTWRTASDNSFKAIFLVADDPYVAGDKDLPRTTQPWHSKDWGQIRADVEAGAQELIARAGQNLGALNAIPNDFNVSVTAIQTALDNENNDRANELLDELDASITAAEQSIAGAPDALEGSNITLYVATDKLNDYLETDGKPRPSTSGGGGGSSTSGGGGGSSSGGGGGGSSTSGGGGGSSGGSSSGGSSSGSSTDRDSNTNCASVTADLDGDGVYEIYEVCE